MQWIKLSDWCIQSDSGYRICKTYSVSSVPEGDLSWRYMAWNPDHKPLCEQWMASADEAKAACEKHAANPYAIDSFETVGRIPR